MLVASLLSPSMTGAPSRMASILSSLIVGTPARLVFLLCVVGSWYLIGARMDKRASVEKELKSEPSSVRGLAFQLLVLSFGVIALVFLYQLHFQAFIYNIERALVQTWAVFLIAIPASGLARRLLKRDGHEQLMVPGRGGHRPFSNFRLFIIVLGVFTVLLVLGVLTGPTGPKWWVS